MPVRGGSASREDRPSASREPERMRELRSERAGPYACRVAELAVSKAVRTPDAAAATRGLGQVTRFACRIDGPGAARGGLLHALIGLIGARARRGNQRTNSVVQSFHHAAGTSKALTCAIAMRTGMRHDTDFDRLAAWMRHTSNPSAASWSVGT